MENPFQLTAEELAKIYSRVIILPDMECHLWDGPVTKKGYGKEWITRLYNYPARIHVALWKHWHGPIEEGLQVRHKCDVNNCVNPLHLLLGTNRDNINDKITRGVTISGRPFIRPIDVYEIRQWWSMGVDRTEIANITGVAYHTVKSVINQSTWKHLREPWQSILPLPM